MPRKRAQDTGSVGYWVGRQVGERALRRVQSDFGTYLGYCTSHLTMYVQSPLVDPHFDTGRVGLSDHAGEMYDRAFVAAVLDLWDEWRGTLVGTTFTWTGRE
jgi:hypothetical protein